MQKFNLVFENTEILNQLIECRDIFEAKEFLNHKGVSLTCDELEELKEEYLELNTPEGENLTMEELDKVAGGAPKAEVVHNKNNIGVKNSTPYSKKKKNSFTFAQGIDAVEQERVKNEKAKFKEDENDREQEALDYFAELFTEANHEQEQYKVDNSTHNTGEQSAERSQMSTYENYEDSKERVMDPHTNGEPPNADHQIPGTGEQSAERSQMSTYENYEDSKERVMDPHTNGEPPNVDHQIPGTGEQPAECGRTSTQKLDPVLPENKKCNGEGDVESREEGSDARTGNGSGPSFPKYFGGQAHGLGQRILITSVGQWSENNNDKSEMFQSEETVVIGNHVSEFGNGQRGVGGNQTNSFRNFGNEEDPSRELGQQEDGKQAEEGTEQSVEDTEQSDSTDNIVVGIRYTTSDCEEVRMQKNAIRIWIGSENEDLLRVVDQLNDVASTDNFIKNRKEALKFFEEEQEKSEKNIGRLNEELNDNEKYQQSIEKTIAGIKARKVKIKANRGQIIQSLEDEKKKAGEFIKKIISEQIREADRIEQLKLRVTEVEKQINQAENLKSILLQKNGSESKLKQVENRYQTEIDKCENSINSIKKSIETNKRQMEVRTLYGSIYEELNVGLNKMGELPLWADQKIKTLDEQIAEAKGDTSEDGLKRLRELEQERKKFLMGVSPEARVERLNKQIEEMKKGIRPEDVPDGWNVEDLEQKKREEISFGEKQRAFWCVNFACEEIERIKEEIEKSESIVEDEHTEMVYNEVQKGVNEIKNCLIYNYHIEEAREELKSCYEDNMRILEKLQEMKAEGPKDLESQERRKIELEAQKEKAEKAIKKAMNDIEAKLKEGAEKEKEQFKRTDKGGTPQEEIFEQIGNEWKRRNDFLDSLLEEQEEQEEQERLRRAQEEQERLRREQKEQEYRTYQKHKDIERKFKEEDQRLSALTINNTTKTHGTSSRGFFSAIEGFFAVIGGFFVRFFGKIASLFNASAIANNDDLYKHLPKEVVDFANENGFGLKRF